MTRWPTGIATLGGLLVGIGVGVLLAQVPIAIAIGLAVGVGIDSVLNHYVNPREDEDDE